MRLPRAANMECMSPNQPGQPPKLPIPGVKNLIAVGSGKGGVGKTTVAVNLAVGLAKLGHPTGLMDADVYGPNVPLMMGINRTPIEDPQEGLWAHQDYCQASSKLSDS